jgi:hypothetical protein
MPTLSAVNSGLRSSLDVALRAEVVDLVGLTWWRCENSDDGVRQVA